MQGQDSHCVPWPPWASCICLCELPGWHWPGSSDLEMPFCTTRHDWGWIKVSAVIFHSCFLGGLCRSLSTLETTSPALAGDGLFSVYTSVPRTDPALCFAGRETRGDYCRVRKGGMRSWWEPWRWKTSVAVCPYCLPAGYWLKWLILMRSFLAAMGNLRGCSASFLLALAL